MKSRAHEAQLKFRVRPRSGTGSSVRQGRHSPDMQRSPETHGRESQKSIGPIIIKSILKQNAERDSARQRQPQRSITYDVFTVWSWDHSFSEVTFGVEVEAVFASSEDVSPQLGSGTGVYYYYIGSRKHYPVYNVVFT